MSTQREESVHDVSSMDEIVGRRIHLLMWDRQLTQTAFAPQVGMIQSSLAKKLRGQRGWSLDDLKAVASVLGVSISYLIGESDEDGAGPNDPKRAMVSKQRTSD